VTIGQADLLADLGEAGQAGGLYRQALAQAETGGQWATLAYLQCALARQDRRAGNYTGALEWLRRAERTAGGRRVSLPLANYAGLRGTVLAEMGHLAEGRRLLGLALAALEHSEAPVDLAQTLFFCARAEFDAGQVESAIDLVDRSLTVAEAVGYDQMLLTEAERAAAMLEACRTRPALAPRANALLARARGLSGVRASLAGRGLISAAPGAARPAATGLEAKLLGPSQVRRDGREIARGEWRSQRPRELFFLLIDCAPLSRDEVLGTFWPDLSQARAVANMHQTLFRLRRAVGEEVAVVDENGFRLAPGLKVRSDVAEFESLARAALNFNPHELRRLGALEAVVALYTGAYLADLDADWVKARRLALSELYVQVLREYSDELLALTRYAEARAILARALALEPLRDDLHSRML